MFNKFKDNINKKYATISIYVVITVLTIFVLGYIIFQLRPIIQWLINGVKWLFKVLAPVIIGVVIAYVLEPFVSFVEKLFCKVPFFYKRKKGCRTTAVISSFIFILAILTALMTIFVYSVTKQLSAMSLSNIIELISGYINSFTESLAGFEEELKEHKMESTLITDFINDISNSLIAWLQKTANNLVDSTKNISGILLNIGVGLVIGIYLLIDKAFLKQCNKIISSAMFSKRANGKLRGYWNDFDSIFSGYIRGTLADVIFMCVVLSITLTVIGIKFGMIIGIFAGLCNLIPYFGPIVAYVGTILFGLLNGQETRVIIAIIALVIVQQIDGSIVGPRLLGNSVRLRPVFVMISVVVGGTVAGAWGMILAVPIAGLLKLIFKRYLDNKIAIREEAVKENTKEVKK